MTNPEFCAGGDMIVRNCGFCSMKLQKQRDDALLQLSEARKNAFQEAIDEVRLECGLGTLDTMVCSNGCHDRLTGKLKAMRDAK